jgi:hypothetical protein
LYRLLVPENEFEAVATVMERAVVFVIWFRFIF